MRWGTRGQAGGRTRIILVAARSGTALSEGPFDEVERLARRVHEEFDWLTGERKAWADTCLGDAEFGLARVGPSGSGDAGA